jgi:tetratricopeptide (TPR) repeat protein
MEAQAYFLAVGDEKSPASCQSSQASILAMRGEYEQALALFQRPIEIYRQLHLYRRLAVNLTKMGKLAWVLGRTHQAHRSFLEARNKFHELGQVPQALSLMISVAATCKDPMQALAYCEQVITESQHSEWPHFALDGLALSAIILTKNGDLEGAKEQIVRAETHARESRDPLVRYYCFRGQYECLTGDFEAARASLAQAEATMLRVNPAGNAILLVPWIHLRAALEPTDLNTSK